MHKFVDRKKRVRSVALCNVTTVCMILSRFPKAFGSL